MASEKDGGTARRGDTDAGSEEVVDDDGDGEWRRSREDLEEETRWVCFRHGALLMILSRVGPTMRPTAVETTPDGGLEEDMVASIRMDQIMEISCRDIYGEF